MQGIQRPKATAPPPAALMSHAYLSQLGRAPGRQVRAASVLCVPSHMKFAHLSLTHSLTHSLALSLSLLLCVRTGRRT
jgi:hypothetical protein